MSTTFDRARAALSFLAVSGNSTEAALDGSQNMALLQGQKGESALVVIQQMNMV